MLKRLIKRYRARKLFRKKCPGHTLWYDCEQCDYGIFVEGTCAGCTLANELGLED